MDGHTYNAIVTLDNGETRTIHAGIFTTLRDAEDYVFRCAKKHDNITNVSVERA